LKQKKKKTLGERLQEKKKKMQDQMQRGRIRTEQMKAEKLRKKKLLEPGTIRYGLFHRQGVGEVMKDALERRRNKRKQK